MEYCLIVFRLSAIEVLNYPLFWSARKRLEFIGEASVFERHQEIDEPDLPLLKEIENTKYADCYA